MLARRRSAAFVERLLIAAVYAPPLMRPIDMILCHVEAERAAPLRLFATPICALTRHYRLRAYAWRLRVARRALPAVLSLCLMIFRCHAPLCRATALNRKMMAIVLHRDARRP